ncbi:hypothetical protein MIND_01296900 [Mycena indigotica]|uniref:Uncharacterized protein n=1 Tax=Mycena indigotica TaxID=2126181 RepID=A0A8H6VUI3_9AGAR|nr:uncharacterized protein MIND_01296900 [Mycena indigotica]KAF7290568.1 hypothetical protein MIND_01296900 [Mycena indigotica]
MSLSNKSRPKSLGPSKIALPPIRLKPDPWFTEFTYDPTRVSRSSLSHLSGCNDFNGTRLDCSFESIDRDFGMAHHGEVYHSSPRLYPQGKEDDERIEDWELGPFATKLPSLHQLGLDRPFADLFSLDDYAQRNRSEPADDDGWDTPERSYHEEMDLDIDEDDSAATMAKLMVASRFAWEALETVPEVDEENDMYPTAKQKGVDIRAENGPAVGQRMMFKDVVNRRWHG